MLVYIVRTIGLSILGVYYSKFAICKDFPDAKIVGNEIHMSDCTYYITEHLVKE